MTGRVFVVQNQRAVHPRTGVLAPKFDLSPAREFGAIVELLPEQVSPFHADGVVSHLSNRLADFGDGDFLLLIGNPALIGLAVAVAAAKNAGRVKMLQWSGTRRRYQPVSFTGIFDCATAPASA
jgi:hypothetical protein